MIKDGYYYPNKEDIRVGWEGEIKSRKLSRDNEWDKYIVGEDYENITINKAISEVPGKGIRVSFLTGEQIEAEGWESLSGYYHTYYKELPTIIKRDGEYFLNDILVNSDSYWLNYDENTQRILIEDYNNNCIYHGKCPDINTFRYLCNLLEIK